MGMSMNYLAGLNEYLHTQCQLLAGMLHNFFIDYPFLNAFLHEIWLAIVFSGLLAFAGLNFISAAAKIRAIMQRRATFDNCARQLAFLALILGWALLTGSRIWLYLTGRSSPEYANPADFILELSWILLSIGVLLESVYYILWRLLKKMSALHCTLGVISAIQNCLALFAIILSIRYLKAASLAATAQNGLAYLLPASFYSPFWEAVVYILPLIFALGAAYANIWLLVRRRRDDFGRDYYNSMLIWCCSWARNAWILVWLAYLAFISRNFFTLYQKGLLTNNILLHEVCLVALWLCPAILWGIVCKSQIALRHKLSLFTSFIIACAFALPLYRQFCSF